MVELFSSEIWKHAQVSSSFSIFDEIIIMHKQVILAVNLLYDQEAAKEYESVEIGDVSSWRQG